MNMSEAVQLFLSEKKPTTAAAYGDVLRNLQTYMNDCDVADVTRMDLKRYQAHLRTRNWRGKPLSQATLNKYAKTCRVFFNWCRDEGEIAESPGGAMMLIRRSKLVPAEKAASDHEFVVMKQFFIKHGKHRNLALLLFLNDTGCRAGGAAGLQVADIDFDNLKAVVTEKRDKTRTVTFGAECRSAIRFWLNHRGVSGGIVFSRNGKPIRASGLSRALRRASQDAGLGNVSSQKFRHRKGFKLAKNRIPLTHSARLLGHSNPATTAEHYYTNDDALIEQINRELIADEEKLTAALYIMSESNTG